MFSHHLGDDAALGGLFGVGRSFRVCRHEVGRPESGAFAEQGGIRDGCGDGASLEPGFTERFLIRPFDRGAESSVSNTPADSGAGRLAGRHLAPSRFNLLVHKCRSRVTAAMTVRD